eukprot:gene19263-2892_t
MRSSRMQQGLLLAACVCTILYVILHGRGTNPPSSSNENSNAVKQQWPAPGGSPVGLLCRGQPDPPGCLMLAASLCTDPLIGGSTRATCPVTCKSCPCGEDAPPESDHCSRHAASGDCDDELVGEVVRASCPNACGICPRPPPPPSPPRYTLDKPAPEGFACVTVAETVAHECSAKHSAEYTSYKPSDEDYAGVCRELDSPAPYLVAATTAFKKNQNRKNEDRDGGGGGPRAVVALTAPLMVMMTTVGAFQSASPIKKTLQGGAAITWEALEPEIQMVVAVDTPTDESPGGMQRVLCDANKHGTPFINAMLQHATNKAVAAGARFVGYTNADIAFSSSLIDMLKGVSASIDQGIISDRLLLIGKRDQRLSYRVPQLHLWDTPFSVAARDSFFVP